MFQTAGTEAGARLSVFLNLKKSSGPGIWLRIASIEVLAGDIWQPLSLEPREVNTRRIGAGQLMLTRKAVAPGTYKSLRLTVEKAALLTDDRRTLLALEKPVVVMPFPAGLTLAREDSLSLFVMFDTEASVRGFAMLTPAMTIAPQPDPLTTDLAYVACPEADTVYLVRTDKNWVNRSIGVSGRPIYPTVDVERNRLYVLASKESKIKVFELSTSRLIDTIQIPLTYDPSFMILGRDSLSAYVLEERAGYLVRMDLRTGNIAGRVRIGQRPQYMIYLPEQDRIAVSSSQSQVVLLLDPVNLGTVETIPVGSAPQGLLVHDDLLYIAESASNTVTVYELRTRRVVRRLNVGFSPRRLWAAGNNVYVANHGSGSVSVFLPGQLAVSSEIKTGGRPLDMNSSENRKWLYVSDAVSGGLIVVDTTSNRVAGRIALGAVPQGLAVIQ